MNRLFWGIILGGITAVGFASSEPTKLQVLLEATFTLQATFQQTVQSEQGKILQKTSGKVWLKKPGKFRWEVMGNDPRLIVANGKKVWDFDKELEQVTVQTFRSGEIQAPIFFLTGDVRSLDNDFKIETLPTTHGVCLQDSNACFTLKPKRAEGSFQWIRIGFKDKVLNRLELLDQLGQYSIFLFKEVKLNAPIADAQFQFVPPSNVDVLIND